MKELQLIGPFKQILPMSGLPLKGAIKDEALPIITDGGILTMGNRIKAIGSFDALYKANKASQLNVTNIASSQVCLPGIVDAHTHICFGGSRAKDYAMRNAGKTYLEIAKSGGGIWDTVTQTRKESMQELAIGILKRIQRQLDNGITTIEVKSGYGLSIEEELKMLRAIRLANEQTPVDLIATCLAAHIFPKDFEGTIEAYLQHISQDLFPILKAEKLCKRVDAFIEEEAFSAGITLPYLLAARQSGFDITVHADQFHPSGSKVAIQCQALSADHLEASTDREIEALAKSEVVAIALPGASLGLGCAFTPARKLLDAGASLAIASDWNPGSAPMGNLWIQAALLGTFQKLSNAEVLAGITFRAANALGLRDRGLLKAGLLADFISFPTNDYREILYHQGQLPPQYVWKEGVLI